MNDVRHIAVIGGGASGLMAAITAAREAHIMHKKLSVSVYETKPRVGKKILVTGNGRCNLTNRNMHSGFYAGDLSLFESIYPQFDNEALTSFFYGLGMGVRTDNAGRVYPLSNQASSVLDALRYEAERLGIEIFTEQKIVSVKKRNDKFVLNDSVYADKVILACGGKACPVHGSDGSGFELLKNLGIGYNEVFPALTALEIDGFTKSLKGIRAEGRIDVKNGGNTTKSACGELQYTEYGISGIPAMQVSRAVSESVYLRKADFVTVTVDSAPSMSPEELKSFLLAEMKRNDLRPSEMLLAGIMPKKLGAYLLSGLSVNPEKNISSIHPAVVDKIVSAVKCKKYKVTGVRGFNDAQVTAGGVSSDELCRETLETKKIKGLYVCGELADVDGDCGGYNLQWAFSSGYVAGKNCVREI